MRKKWIFIVPAALAGLALFIGLGGGLVYLLWNWLLPSLFAFPQITFWQALGLLALCRILFGGRPGPGRWGFGRHARERWGHLSDDERQNLRRRMRERWGFGPPAPAGPTGAETTP